MFDHPKSGTRFWFPFGRPENSSMRLSVKCQQTFWKFDRFGPHIPLILLGMTG